MTILGTLWGIGVGPGDPDLMTVKAVKAMNAADVVYAAGNERNAGSLALDIAKPHLSPSVKVVLLPTPHTFDSVDGREAHREAAKVLLPELQKGLTVAFLTIGDPMTYSTFTYLMKELLELKPELNVKVVPGITSYSAAAAEALTPLAEGDETLTIVGASRTLEPLAAALETADNLVIMKPYRNAAKVCDMLEENNLGDSAVFCAEVSRPTQLLARTTRKAREALGRYMSLFLVRRKGGSRS